MAAAPAARLSRGAGAAVPRSRAGGRALPRWLESHQRRASHVDEGSERGNTRGTDDAGHVHVFVSSLFPVYSFFCHDEDNHRQIGSQLASSIILGNAPRARGFKHPLLHIG